MTDRLFCSATGRRRLAKISGVTGDEFRPAAADFPPAETYYAS